MSDESTRSSDFPVEAVRAAMNQARAQNLSLPIEADGDDDRDLLDDAVDAVLATGRRGPVLVYVHFRADFVEEGKPTFEVSHRISVDEPLPGYDAEEIHTMTVTIVDEPANER